MTRVMAQITADFDQVSVEDILDGWTDEEVRNLATSNSEALDELATAIYQRDEPADIFVSLGRSQVEEYLAARGLPLGENVS